MAEENDEWTEGHNMFNMTVSQRNELLLRYASGSREYQEQLDKLLKSWVKSQPTLWVKYRESLNPNQSSKSKKKPELSPEELLAFDKSSQNNVKEYYAFWYQNTKRDTVKITQTNDPKCKVKITDVTSAKDQDLEKLKKLAYYVPKLVLRRLFNNKSIVKPPESESFPAAVVFADISGFTPLTEKLANRGLEGIEKLTTELNTYFTKLTSIIHKHGGDILKFAGDAVLVAWPTGKESELGGMTMLACQASKTLLKELGDYQVASAEGSVLQLHIGIGCGIISGINVGGVNNRAEFFISGSVLDQVSACEKEANPGEAYISKTAFETIQKGRLTVSQKNSNSNYLVEEIEYPVDLPEEISFPLYADMEPSIKLYLQEAVVLHAQSGSVRPLAELRTVTVIFLNLTAPFKDEKLPELQQTISAMQSIVDKYEGTVRQFMIDDKGSVLIVGFGLPPKSHNDDPVRAIRTAIELLAVSTVPCSIGVTTGKAFCGDVGSKQRKEYAMVGDIVNLSARLMVASKSRGGLLCDIDTFEAGKNAKGLAFKRLDEIKVKGKTQPIPIFVPSFGESQGGREEKVDTEIIGRDAELKQLEVLVKEVVPKIGSNRTGSPNRTKNRVSLFPGGSQTTVHVPTNLVLVTGDEGSGKTRLLRYVEMLARERKSKVLSCAADPINNATQYYAWSDIFQSLLEKGKLPQSVINEVGADKAPLLNFMLPQPLEEPPSLSKMSAQLRSETTKEILGKLLEKIAVPGSCLLIDNAHWLDTASWALVSLVSTFDDILIVIGMRKLGKGKLPLQYTQLSNRSNVLQINLENLSQENTTKLIGTILNIKKVPPFIASEIYNKSKGNPYITEEIVNALKESKALPPPNKNGEVVVNAEVEKVLKQVPSSLNGLLTSKIDRLNPSLQLILKVASVIGEKFSLELLTELMQKETQKNKSELIQDLDALLKAGVLLKEEEENTYAFSNVLVRDAVYGIMLFAQKRELHSRLAEYIKGKYPGMPKFYPNLAYHYKQASGEDPKEQEAFEDAIEFFKKAGSISLSSYANKEASEFFKEAIKLVEKTENRNGIEAISMSRKLGQAFYNLGQFTEADTHLRKGLTKMDINVPSDNSKTKPNSGQKQKVNSWKFGTNSSDDIAHRKREAFLILLALARLNFYACNRNISTWCAEVALQLEEVVGPVLTAEAHAIYALCLSFNSDFKKAEEEISRGQEKANGHVDVEKIVYQMAGMVYSSYSQFDKAEQAFNNALQASKTVGDLRTFEEITVFLGTVYYFRGDIAKSVEMTKDAIRSGRERSDIQSQVLSMNAQSRNFYALGENEQCLKYLNEVDLALEFLKPPASTDKTAMAVSDITAQINYFGLRALMELRTHNIEVAANNASQLLSILKEKDIVAYFTFDGYAAAVEFYLLFIQQFKLWRKSDSKKKLLSKAEKALNILIKFSQSFSFAQPRVELWKGHVSYHNNKKSKFEEESKKSEELASKLSMNFELALCLYERSIISGSREDFERACQIFPEIKLRAAALKSLRDTLTEEEQSPKVTPPESPANATTAPKRGSVPDSSKVTPDSKSDATTPKRGSFPDSSKATPDPKSAPVTSPPPNTSSSSSNSPPSTPSIKDRISNFEQK